MNEVGRCKLTGCYGKFVKSHLLPKALTRPSRSGLGFVQAGYGTRPIRRWDSWYDPKLTIRKGEDILERLDTWAIAKLRANRLLWSGWTAGNTSFTDDIDFVPGTSDGVRKVVGIDPIRLRLFFLSLLWRAAATDISEFAAVSIPSSDLQKVRDLLLAGDPGPKDFYPTQLIQLYTKGEIHNHTPIGLSKTITDSDNFRDRELPMFRIYFDGLIAHVHRHASDDGYTATQGCLTVGDGDTLAVVAVPYETSFQRNILEVIKNQAAVTWPDVLDRLASTREPNLP